jgi:regulator of chromosome condensation, RCC1 (fragment)
MKKLLLILLPLAVVCGCGEVDLSGENNSDNPYIPDDPKEDPEPDPEPENDIFLQFCIERFDTNGDGVISQYEADKVKSITCSGMEIANLTDIDKFSNLETLDCSYNSLTSLDLSKNRHLTRVNCKHNSLRTLSVTGCKELRTLDCSYNSLSSLDLSSAMILEGVDCSNNLLATLNVGGCSALLTLDCSYNSLSALDLSSATALENVDCFNNSLMTLKVGGCLALRILDCSYNKLPTLDLSKTTGIVTLNCKRNSLTSLILTDCTALASLDCSYNSLTSLDVSNCLKLSALNCTDNPYLKELILLNNLQEITNLNKDSHTEIKYSDSRHYYSIGEKYSQNGKDGIVFYITNNGLHGKIVSEDNVDYKWSTEYISTGAINNNDGMANMKKIQAISGWHEKFPAFAWCADKGEGWYLPALNELKMLFESKIINSYSYWSSTEYDIGNAWLVNLLDGSTNGNHKKDYYNVRAVSAF